MNNNLRNAAGGRRVAVFSNGVKQFDVPGGYSRSSGFFNLFQSLKPIDKARILARMNLDRRAYDIMPRFKWRYVILWIYMG